MIELRDGGKHSVLCQDLGITSGSYQAFGNVRTSEPLHVLSALMSIPWKPCQEIAGIMSDLSIVTGPQHDVGPS